MQTSAQARGRIALGRAGTPHDAWLRGFRIGVLFGVLVVGVAAATFGAFAESGTEGSTKGVHEVYPADADALASDPGQGTAAGEEAHSRFEAPSRAKDVCPWYD